MSRRRSTGSPAEGNSAWPRFVRAGAGNVRPGRRCLANVQRIPGVAKHCLAHVRPKDRPQITAANLDQVEEHGQPVLPTHRELGRILAIAQSGVLPRALSLAIELTLRSVQRRSTVAPCARNQMEGVLEADAHNVKMGHLYWTAWVVPPYFMKGRKATKSEPSTLPHLVPIPSDLAFGLDELHRMNGVRIELVFPGCATPPARAALEIPVYESVDVKPCILMDA